MMTPRTALAAGWYSLTDEEEKGKPMIAKSVQEVVDALRAGAGPVEVTRTLAAQLATQHPGLLDGELKLLRLSAFGPPPYTGPQYGAFELRILPDPDVPSRAESKARAKFDKALAEAREHEAVASAAYEAAESRYFEASGLALAAGASTQMAVSVTGQPIGPQKQVLASMSGEPLRVGQAERDEVAALREAEGVAREAWQEAGSALQKARIALAKVERRIEWATRVARS